MNRPASVRQRLLNHARANDLLFDLVLTRYALERLLYRLSLSPQRDQFVLKGALALASESASWHRPTRDMDLLGTGSPVPERLEALFRQWCQIPVEDDGLRFDPASVRVVPIREDTLYGGVRVSLRADLDGARIALQCDVGFGGPVVPAPQERDFPTLLLFPAPRIRVYARETIVAEKCEAMVSLGIQNSRMKDFFDLYGLARQESFSGPALCGALHHTFTYRQTPFPATMPLAWSAAFGADGGKLDQWSSFVRRLGTTLAAIPTLESVTALLGEFLWPPLASLGTGESFEGSWPPGGPWQEH